MQLYMDELKAWYQELSAKQVLNEAASITSLGRDYTDITIVTIVTFMRNVRFANKDFNKYFALKKRNAGSNFCHRLLIIGIIITD